VTFTGIRPSRMDSRAGAWTPAGRSESSGLRQRWILEKGYGGRLSGTGEGDNHNNRRECIIVSCPFSTVIVTQTASMRTVGDNDINS